MEQTTMPPMAKTPRRYNIAAWLAIVAMAALTLLAIKALNMEPSTIVKHETRIVTSDSMVYYQKKCAALEVKCDGLQALADERGRTLAQLGPTLQRAIDSSLKLNAAMNTGVLNIASTLNDAVERRNQQEREKALVFRNLAEMIQARPDSAQLAALIARQPVLLQPLPVPMVGLPRSSQKRWEVRAETFTEVRWDQQFNTSFGGGARWYLNKTSRP